MEHAELLQILVTIILAATIPLIGIFAWRGIADGRRASDQARDYRSDVDQNIELSKATAELHRQSAQHMERIAQSMERIATAIEKRKDWPQ